jgi:hypothetical protein
LIRYDPTRVLASGKSVEATFFGREASKSDETQFSENPDGSTA